ncbi:MAG: hypothetical protein WD066_20100 [Planctomycetaceae bacterium]
MHLLIRTPDWFDRAGDRANAILVKETRQALKSRQFLLAFLLQLAGAWLVSLFAMLQHAETLDYAPAGRDFFTGFYFVLLAAVFVMVPFNAFRSLLAEREQNTYDVLAITVVTPGQIVRGKLLSAVVQMFLYYSAITPFIAFASLLNGFDLAEATFLLVASVFISIGCTMAAIFLAAQESTLRWPTLSSLAVLAGLVFLLVGYYGGVLDMMRMDEFGRAFRDRDFWWVLGGLGVAWLTYFVLFMQLAAAGLTFASDNRGTGIRITCALQFWLLWGVAFGVVSMTGARVDSELVFALASISGLHWLVVGTFVATEPPTLSRRTFQRLPKSTLFRLLLVPLLPGGGRGFLYVGLHAVALAGVAAAMSWTIPVSYSWGPRLESVAPYSIAIACQLVMYVGFAAWLGRVLPKLAPAARPQHARMLMALVVAVGSIVPVVVHFVRDVGMFQYNLLDVVSPLASLIAVDQRGGRPIEGFFPAGPILAVAIFALNVPAMLRGIREVLDPEPSPAAVESDHVPR